MPSEGNLPGCSIAVRSRYSIDAMEMYQHDNAGAFRFVLRGELSGRQVPELECAWTTAQSILNGRDLAVDVSGVTNADKSGVDLLLRMRDSGARLGAPLPLASEELLRSLGLPVAVRAGGNLTQRALRWLGFSTA